MKYDFSGWATRNNLRCTDGRIINKDAFKHDDGQIVPLVWNHQHNDPLNILGHALLKNKDEGVYTYCTFNDTESGKTAKILVEHGDIVALSICANQLKQQGANVLHGAIREVSLVLAGANPGAYIESVLSHGELSEEEAIIYTGENITLYHAEDDVKKNDTPAEEKKSKKEETIEDVFNTLTEKQKTVVYAIIRGVLDNQESGDEDDDKNNDNSKGGNKTMKHNLFDNEEQQESNILSHSEIMAIVADGKRYGSLKESMLAHGIENIDYLFPEAKTPANTPEFIQRDTGWVHTVMNAVHHTPFSRIKSVFADITEDDARAKGYIKGKMKKDEVFSLLKRTTDPTTIYKKQKIDRDDVVDITDFGVVAWIKAEMRSMLDEEIARAVLVGDGRLASSDDKIKGDSVRSIWTDDDLYTIKQAVEVSGSTSKSERAREFIRAAIKSRKDYKGSGNPSMFITEDLLTECLLLTDSTGRDLYDSPEKLATKLRVREIVTVPVMENLSRVDSTTKKTRELGAIIVNLADYNIGADKGGAVNMFDDFDIDYNAQKYLIETRCSGALIKPYAAIAIEFEATTTSSSASN